jgi:LacI family transcriptional regulator
VGPSRTLNGITSKAEVLGYTLVLKELREFSGYDINSILDDLLARQVDGIIWAVTEMGDNREGFAARLPTLLVPVVFLTMRDQPGWNIVTVDNRLGGRLATQHLLDLGHTVIGHISGPIDWWEARRRKQGWILALEEVGLIDGGELCVEGNWSSESGRQAIANLLGKRPDVSAVFVGNDQMALGVLLYAHENGLRVPEDLAVVGYDGIHEAAYFWPPLTTVEQDQHELGCVAVEELVRRIEARNTEMVLDEPQTILLEPKLIKRTSSGLFFSSDHQQQLQTFKHVRR